MDIEVKQSSEHLNPVQTTYQEPVPHSPEISPPPVAITQEEEKQSLFPYLACLSAFVILLLNSFYSVVSLINYSIDKLLITQKATSYDYSYFSGVDSFLVLYSVSSLIISIPALVVLLLKLRKTENKQPWRVSQKWHRIIYTIAMIVMIFSLIGTLIGTVYGLFSINLDPSSSSSYYVSEPAPITDKNTRYLVTVLSGISAAVLFTLALFTLGSEYANKLRKSVWFVLLVLGVLGAAAGTFSLIKVYEPIQKTSNATTPYHRSDCPNC